MNQSTNLAVCLKEDDFLREAQLSRKTAVWIASLSNGESVWMDDDWPGVEPASAWKRLAEYVKEQNLQIKNVSLKFRSNFQQNIFPDGPDGVFFSKMATAFWGSKRNFFFYLVGYLQDGILRVRKYKTPELILMDETERDPQKNMSNIIFNRGVLSY